MTPESVMTIGRTAMEVTILVASPVLLVTLVVGLIISVFQAATQINDASLSFIPKMHCRAYHLRHRRPLDADRDDRLPATRAHRPAWHHH